MLDFAKISCHLLPSNFYRVFGRFSAWRAQKHHKNIFQNQTKKSQKSQKK
jgi:hypothetical protein